MSMTKVWNITDDESNPNVRSQLRMVLGRAVKPGRAVQVEEARLVNAHKVHKDVEAKLLFIGPRPPVSYQQMRKPPRAVADARLVGADGRVNPSEAKPKVRAGHNRPDPALQAPPKTDAPAEIVAEAAVEVVVPKETVKVEFSSKEGEASKEEEDSSKGSRRRPRR